MDFEGKGIAIVGALDAFPKRLARREIEAGGGFFRRSLSRRIDWAVFGHRLIGKGSADRIAGKLAQSINFGILPVSERSFLQSIGASRLNSSIRDLSESQLLRQSKLAKSDFDLLALFDAFDFSSEPFGFRDLVAARQYAKLLKDGIDCCRLIQVIRTQGRGDDGSLSDIRLERTSWDDVVARAGGTVTEIDGQHILPLPTIHPIDQANDLFETAELAEEQEDWIAAARLYRKCLEIDREDPTIPFNLSHALMKAGDVQSAVHYLHLTLKIDPEYAEAWYNLGSITSSLGKMNSSKRNFEKAIEVDPEYPDPVYNLALLEFESENYGKAARLWQCYIKLDPNSDWTQKAKHGLQLIEMINKNDNASCTIAFEELRAV